MEKKDEELHKRLKMIIRPRLSDYYNIPLLQSEVDFAIPFIDEDIP